MAHHPYSFTNPTDPVVTRQRRPFQLSDERGRAWDSEAPATAHDSDLEAKESRAPLYIAGAASVVILGGLLLLANAATGDPPLGATLETESVPRQAALGAMLDAQALDSARVAIRGVAPSAPQSSNATVAEPTSVESPSVESPSIAPMSAPTSAAPMSTDSTTAEPASTPLSDEPLMTPAPAPTTPSPVVLDRDNPYTSENEAPEPSSDGSSESATPRGAASDNPY